MSQRKIFKAVLFDADGTLYDSTMLHFEAYKKVSRELYGFDFTEKLFFDECIDLYKKPTQVLREQGVKCKDEDFYSKKRPYYYEIAKQKLKPTAGLIKLLKELKRAYVPCVIVSGASRDSLEDSLTILGIKEFFDFRIAYEDSPEQQKPDPFPYQLALQRLSLSPDEGLAFEDTKSGIEAAKRAGLNCIGIKNKTNNRELLSSSDMIITDFNEIDCTFNKGLELSFT